MCNIIYFVSVSDIMAKLVFIKDVIRKIFFFFNCCVITKCESQPQLYIHKLFNNNLLIKLTDSVD